MPYQAFTYKQRPDLVEQAVLFNELGWPIFMCQDPNEQQYWSLLETLFPQFQLMLCLADEVVAVGSAVPLYWDGTTEGLPGGWGAALAQGIQDFQRERSTNCVSALSVVVHPEHRRKGLSRLVLQAMCREIKQQHLDHLIAPVRPSLKQYYPRTPIEQYIAWQQSDGTPFDSWVRVHWGLGAKILALAPESMTVTGSLSQWQEWTGIDFPASGEYLIPGALQPVVVDTVKGCGYYKEPNVWMHHALSSENYHSF